MLGRIKLADLIPPVAEVFLKKQWPCQGTLDRQLPILNSRDSSPLRHVHIHGHNQLIASRLAGRDRVHTATTGVCPVR